MKLNNLDKNCFDVPQNSQSMHQKDVIAKKEKNKPHQPLTRSGETSTLIVSKFFLTVVSSSSARTGPCLFKYFSKKTGLTFYILSLV